MKYYIAFNAILRKEITRFMRIWPQTIMPSCVTISLYFIIFGNIIGSQVRDIDGFRYMAYIVPGLVMMAVINNSYINVVSSFFGAKLQKAIEEILVAPVPNYLILLAYVAAGCLRGIIVGFLVTLISLFFAKLHMYNWALMLLVTIFSASLFALAGFINAIFAKKFDDVNIVPTFILLPLIYLGGVFYSVDVLPYPWNMISHLNPIFYIINAFRYTVLGVADINFAIAFTVLLTCVVIFYVIALKLLQKGVGLRE